MLENHWYIACRSRALRARPRAFTAFDRRFVAFRDADGRCGVLLDRCAHRNAPLSAGRVDGTLLRCPYHGWGYGVDGTVGDIPSCPPGERPDKSPCTDAFACVEQDGYVWFSLARDEPATPAPTRFAHLGESGWTTFRMETLFEGSVESCVENFLDCPHATHVHRYWFRTPTRKTVRAVVERTSDGAVAEYFDEPREGSVVWTMLSRKSARMRHTDRFIAPATTRVDYAFDDRRHFVITSSCTPETDSRTRVHTVMTFRFGRLGWLIRLGFEPLSRRIIRQDVDMVRLQQRNVESFGGKRYHVVRQDLLFRHIARWRQAIRDGHGQDSAEGSGAAEPRTVELRL